MDVNGNLPTTTATVAPPPIAPVDRLMNEIETAALLGVAVNTLRDWRVRTSKLSFVKVGRLVRYRASDVSTFIAANTRANTSEVA